MKFSLCVCKNASSAGGDERSMATGKPEKILQRERNTCECMVSSGSQWGCVGFPCCCGQSYSEGHCIEIRQECGTGELNIKHDRQYTWIM